MKITKIKYDGTQVQINYITEVKDSNGKTIAEINSEFRSKEKPLQSFKDALNDLRNEVQEILKDALKDNACKDADIRGVSISHANEIMGAVITALIPVTSANSPMVVNTPHLPSEDYNTNSEFSDAPILPYSCTLKIRTLIDEAIGFYNGEREKPDELFPTN